MWTREKREGGAEWNCKELMWIKLVISNNYGNEEVGSNGRIRLKLDAM